MDCELYYGLVLQMINIVINIIRYLINTQFICLPKSQSILLFKPITYSSTEYIKISFMKVNICSAITLIYISEYKPRYIILLLTYIWKLAWNFLLDSVIIRLYNIRQGGILSPKLYSVYVDDLSEYLVKSQIGCHIDNVCVNHVMYADDICLMAPSPAALQKLINICYDFSIQNNLSFNSTKSFCMVLKSRLYNLVCPTFYMNTEILDYAANIKYLGFTFSSDKKDDSDMLRQMRVFYTKANRLLRLFHCCSTDVKLALFRSYCACFYCPFLWTHYKKSTHSKLRVAFNNVHRRILKLPPRSSASTMYAVNHIDSFEILIRKRVVGFIERLKVSNNSIISCIDNSWKMKFEIWNPWIKLLYK